MSAYWNGAATYYRGLIRALRGRGYDVAFHEPDACQRQQHRDIPDPPWAKVVVYPGEDGVRRCLDRAARADLIVKASGVGAFDALLEAAVPRLRRSGNRVIFWDVDAPATLARVQADARDPFRALGHVPTADHNAFNCTPLAVLNVRRRRRWRATWRNEQRARVLAEHPSAHRALELERHLSEVERRPRRASRSARARLPS